MSDQQDQLPSEGDGGAPERPATLLRAGWRAAAAALVGKRTGSADAAHGGVAADRDGADLLDLCPDPIVIVNGRSLVLSANPPALALLRGLRPGQPLAIGLRAPQVLDTVSSVIADRAGRDTTFGGLMPVDPTYEVRIRAFPGGIGSEAAAALFFRDLTAERRLETMRVDFVANASHELRTPLASVLGFIETLQGPARDDPGARERFLEIMRVQASRMARLIDDLLRLSRVEMHAHQLPTARLDLGPVVGHIVEVMAPLARERNVTLDLLMPAEPLVVLGDRDEMIRVVENLLENAIKYGGSGKRVEVGLSRRGQGSRPHIGLTVRDRGPGIAPEHLPRLTERFYRVDAGESRREGGTGLGLAIVKHIVGRHRGRMTIDSTPGQGTTVTVAIPSADMAVI